MAEIPVTILPPIVDATPSDDGSHVLIRTEQSPGSHLVLAVKREEIGKLIAALAFGNTQCRKVLGISDDIRESFHVNWGEMSGDVRTNPILSLVIGAAGRLDFAIGPNAPMQMLEFLQTQLEQPTFPTPTGKPN